MEKANILLNNLSVVLVSFQFSQKDLATYLKVSKTTVNRWCTNAVQPSLEQLHAIANFFRISVTTLVRERIVEQNESDTQAPYLVYLQNKEANKAANQEVSFTEDYLATLKGEIAKYVDETVVKKIDPTSLDRIAKVLTTCKTKKSQSEVFESLGLTKPFPKWPFIIDLLTENGWIAENEKARVLYYRTTTDGKSLLKAVEKDGMLPK
ncbi:Transcriptional regulator, contains XRE-family HTH domain [bacterium A37T11]|nr:Transcriptional regulator, contains XRE-family HTH domain [bacterium A37T11]